MTAIAIETMHHGDWPAVRDIYAQGIVTGDATFEIDAPDWQTWDAAHRPDCRLVARREGAIVGWVALSPWSARHVYRGVAWESVYVAEGARGKGVGPALLKAIITASEAAPLLAADSTTFPSSLACIRSGRTPGRRRFGGREGDVLQ